jgi:mono/diheme cytochrome c family protein
MGLLIARDRCSGCHQTGGGGESPNPRAPTFGEIVDRPGMTAESLRAILRDSHNFPIEMGFQLEPHQVDSLVAYMVRWRAEGAPPQS